MSVDNTTGEAVRTFVLSLMVLFSVVAMVPFSGAVHAEGQDAVFNSFDVEFDSADPEEPHDVTVEWELDEGAENAEEIRIAVDNESGESINLFKPNGTDVPNPFVVSTADESETADVVVEDLTADTLALKVPVGHCDRIDAAQAVAYDGDGETIGPPATLQELSCGPSGETETFEVTIEKYDEEVIEGDRVNVTAEIENTGESEGTQDIRFLADESRVDSLENLTLAENQSETVSFSYATNESNVPELEIAVETDDDIANRTVAVTQLEPAFFAVTIEELSTEIAAGEILDVEAQVENTGDVNGTQNVTLADFDGEVVDTETDIDLAPGESTNVSLNWSTEDSDIGTKNVTVRSENNTDTATVEIREPAVESITATLEDTDLEAGEETFVTVEATLTDDSTMNVTDNATFTSLDPDVATVTTNGTVLAETEGTTEIEAVFENKTDTDTLTVKAPDSESDGSGGSDSEEDGSEDSGSGSDSSGSSGSESDSSGSSGSESDSSGSSGSGKDGSEADNSESSDSGSNDFGSDDSGSDDGSDDESDDAGNDDSGTDVSRSDDAGSNDPESDDIERGDSNAHEDPTSSVIVSPVIGWLLFVPLLTARDWSLPP